MECREYFTGWAEYGHRKCTSALCAPAKPGYPRVSSGKVPLQSTSPCWTRAATFSHPSMATLPRLASEVCSYLERCSNLASAAPCDRPGNLIHLECGPTWPADASPPSTQRASHPPPTRTLPNCARECKISQVRNGQSVATCGTYADCE